MRAYSRGTQRCCRITINLRRGDDRSEVLSISIIKFENGKTVRIEYEIVAMLHLPLLSLDSAKDSRTYAMVFLVPYYDTFQGVISLDSRSEGSRRRSLLILFSP